MNCGEETRGKEDVGEKRVQKSRSEGGAKQAE
jgi:hypothetical protein